MKTYNDKDKVYFIYYLNVKNLAPDKARMFISEIDYAFKDKFDETVRFIIVPTETYTHVELLNLANLSNIENEAKVTSLIKDLENILNKQ